MKLASIDIGLKRIGVAISLINNIVTPQNAIIRKNRNQAALEVNNEKTGIAKGYDFQFLRDTFSLEKVKNIIQNDLRIFGEIEKSLLSLATPKEGDFVKYDGGISRLSRIHPGGSVQLSENIGVNVWHDTTQSSRCIVTGKQIGRAHV